MLNKYKTQPSSLPQQHNKLSFQNQRVEWNTKFTEEMRHCTYNGNTDRIHIQRLYCMYNMHMSAFRSVTH
jgi:hypothetical protein